MRSPGHGTASQNGLKLASRFQSLQFGAAPRRPINCALSRLPESDSQTLAAFGAASIDHGATATGFHANQEAVSAGAFDLGRLVSAFHLEIL